MSKIRLLIIILFALFIVTNKIVANDTILTIKLSYLGLSDKMKPPLLITNDEQIDSNFYKYGFDKFFTSYIIKKITCIVSLKTMHLLMNKFEDYRINKNDTASNINTDYGYICIAEYKNEKLIRKYYTKNIHEGILLLNNIINSLKENKSDDKLIEYVDNFIINISGH